MNIDPKIIEVDVSIGITHLNESNHFEVELDGFLLWALDKISAHEVIDPGAVIAQIIAFGICQRAENAINENKHIDN